MSKNKALKLSVVERIVDIFILKTTTNISRNKRMTLIGRKRFWEKNVNNSLNYWEAESSVFDNS